MAIVRLLILSACLFLGAVTLAACAKEKGRATCDIDEFFTHDGREYVLGDMVASGELVSCGEVVAVGKDYVRHDSDRVAGWRCVAAPAEDLGIYLTCVKRCSRIDLIVINLAPGGRAQVKPELPLRCGPRLQPFDG